MVENGCIYRHDDFRGGKEGERVSEVTRRDGSRE
jgi:hypothetical protein